ncbi:hypothetical protein [Gordonia zhaorongruii]|uniref:hypothetical protein n=1 Tax=Gordonia zhaorongruii TaxID=2597659 RepID=UPI00117ED861|nr:hypothetical protein [Gordonia zhaorongruii]
MTAPIDATLTGEAPRGRGITWEQAFPEWHLVEENARVDGGRPIVLTPHEERIDTILEIAATFRGSVDHAAGRLYPLVPSLFPLSMDGQSTTIPFSKIAASPAADAFASSTRGAIRRGHQTLAQVNLASAIVGAQQWPSDPILAAFAAKFFHLHPLDCYLITHVGIGRNSPERAQRFVAETVDVSDVSSYLESITGKAYSSILDDELTQWLEPLIAKDTPIEVAAVAETHPQLLGRLPMQDCTLAEALGFLVPGWNLRDGQFVRFESHSAAADIGDRALSLITAQPGITSSQLTANIGTEPATVNRLLATRGQAYSRPHRGDAGDRTWTTPTWHRLGIHDPAELKELLVREELAPEDLGLPHGTAADTADAPGPIAAPDARELPPAPAADPSAATPSVAEPSDTAPPEAEVPVSPPEPEVETRGDLPASTDPLETWEKALVHRFEGATLAAEMNLTDDELDRLLDAYSVRFATSQARRTATKIFVHHFPASTLAALVGVASTEFENNTYWSHFFQAIKAKQNDAVENALRQAVMGLIEKFGLDPLSGLPAARYVERLTVHAGIPASSFGALLNALMSYVALVDNREDRPFREWIEEPSHEVLLHSLTAPARSFIRHGGPKATDYLTVLVGVVSKVAEDPTLDGAAVTAALGDDDLPPLVRDALAGAFHRMDVGEEVRLKRHRSRSVPTLHLGADDSVIIRLPAPSSYADKQWAITLDSDVRHVSPGRLDRDHGVDVILDAPVRRAVVSHPSFEHPIEMRLFDAESPLIAFSVNGDHLPSSQRLPRDEVALLYPKTLSIAGDDGAAPVRRGEFPPPQGWSGWTLETWDLSEATTFRLSSSTSARPVDIAVGTRPLPTLDLTDGEALPLDGVTHRGLPVFGQARPWVLLPPLRDTDTSGWTVQYRRSGSSEWITQDEYLPAELESRELFAGEPPLLGPYEILVTGPDSARFRTDLFLADGLTVSFSEDYRIPDDDQMTPITAFIEHSEPALQVGTGHIDFNGSTSHQDLQLRLGDTRHEVRIRPPRLEFRMTPVGGIPVWSDRRISRHPDEFYHATLSIRGVPEGVDADIELVNGSDIVQHRCSLQDSRARGALAVKTDEFAHAARTCQFGELRVLLRYPDGDSYPAPLIRFSTLGHDHKVELDGNTIVVSNVPTDQHLECHVWQMDRPWLEPMSVPVEDGRADLPASVRDGGNLRVSLHVSDAWDPVPPARFPDNRSVRLDRRGDFTSSGKGLVSQFLSGENHLPAFDAATPEAWAALAFLDLELDAHDRSRYEAIAEVMTARPRVAARSLAEANLPNGEKVAQFVGSGLVFRGLIDPAGPTRRHEAVPEAWLDMLFTIADIPSQADDIRTVLLERIGEVGGSSLRCILAEGKDPEATKTYIDSGSVRIDPDTLRSVLQDRKLIPGGLVDASARYESYLELFERRDEVSKELLHDLNTVAAHDKRAPFMAIRKYHALRDEFNIRSEYLDGVDPVEDGWACATFISLGLALYARLVARRLLEPEGRSDAARLRKTWSRFARLQPLEAMIDVVIADGLAAHHFFAGRGQFPYTEFDPHSVALVDRLLAPLVSTPERSLIRE